MAVEGAEDITLKVSMSDDECDSCEDDDYSDSSSDSSNDGCIFVCSACSFSITRVLHMHKFSTIAITDDEIKKVGAFCPVEGMLIDNIKTTEDGSVLEGAVHCPKCYSFLGWKIVDKKDKNIIIRKGVYVLLMDKLTEVLPP